MASAAGQEVEIRYQRETTWATGTASTAISDPPFEDVEWGYVQNTNVIRNILSSASVQDVAFGQRHVESRLRGVMDYDNFMAILRQILGSGNKTASGNASLYDFELKGTLPSGTKMEIWHNDLTTSTATNGTGYRLIGGKFPRMTLSMNEAEGMNYEFQGVFKEASYQTSEPSFAQIAASELITADDFSFSIFGDTSVCVSSWTVTIEQPQNLDQACIGSTVDLRNEPSRSDQRQITLDFELEFQDSAHWSQFVNKTTGVVSMGANGDTAKGATNTANRIRLYFPRCRTLGFQVPTSGSGRILQRVSMQALQSAVAGDEFNLYLVCGTSVAI